VVVVILAKGEKRISKPDLKEEELHWKRSIEIPRLGDLLDVLCRDTGDLGILPLDVLECWRFHLE
jgi:hypothetical protein